MELKIEKGIPMPTHARSGLSATLRSMEIGDSVLVPPPIKNTTISAAVYRVGKATGFAFTMRKVEGGTRVWRVKPAQR